MDTRILASGRIAALDESGRVVEILSDEDYLYDLHEGQPTCSICDAEGHGYPGAGPCPLEDYSYAGEPNWAL